MTAPGARPTLSTTATHAAWFDHAVQMAGGPVGDPRQLLAGWELADAIAEFLRRHRTNRLETRKAPGRSWPRRVRGWRLASSDDGDWWLTKRGEWYRWDGGRLAPSGQPPVTCTADVLARMGDFLGVVSVTR
jgi:hypothetical protein